MAQPESSTEVDPGVPCDAATLLSALDVAAPVGLFLLDRDLRVRYLNRTAARLTGQRAGTGLGEPVRAIFTGAPAGFVDAMRRTLATGEPSGAMELEVAGPRTWWCSFFRQDAAESGPMVGGVVIDVTDRHLVDLGRAEVLSDERAARSELERVRDRLAFLVHASSRLAASLDVATTLSTVGDLMVPRFGTMCIVDLWDGQRLERVHVRGLDSADPDLIARVRELTGRQIDGHPAVRAIRTGQPVLIPSTDANLVATMYTEPADREVVLAVTAGQGFTAVPLSTHGRVIGAITLIGKERTGARDRSGHDDLTLVEQVASRAAQSIENARLFDAERRLARSLRDSERQQRQTALTLQRTLLPASTYQPAELEVAARYMPGAEEAEVGGDWYDVIPLTPARTALVIGDVMGRGLRAATLMGQVRTAVRAYARQDLDPKEILGLVDGIVADLDTSEIVTCAYAVFDAVRGTLTYASAGHLPPLIAEPGKPARRLDHETGIALGVATCGARDHIIEIPPGALVALYTDGLVEHRERDVDAGIDILASMLYGAGGTMEDICDRVIRALRPPLGYDDDVALLLARPYDLAAADAPRAVALAIPEDPSSVSLVRGEVDRALRRWGVPGDLRSNIVLTTSELVANALRHATPPIKLHLRRRAAAIDIEVSDGTPQPPQRLQPTPTDENGRGLLLISRLADRWGWHRTDRGKTVWCEHTLPARVS